MSKNDLSALLSVRVRQYNENAWRGFSADALKAQRDAIIDDIASAFDLMRVTAEFRFWRLSRELLDNEM